MTFENSSILTRPRSSPIIVLAFNLCSHGIHPLFQRSNNDTDVAVIMFDTTCPDFLFSFGILGYTHLLELYRKKQLGLTDPDGLGLRCPWLLCGLAMYAAGTGKSGKALALPLPYLLRRASQLRQPSYTSGIKAALFSFLRYPVLPHSGSDLLLHQLLEG